MKRVAAKIVPKLFNIAQKILTTFNDDPDLLKKVITSDESWVYGNDIEIEDQTSRFAPIEEIEKISKLELLAIPKIAFQKWLEDWKNDGISVFYLRGVKLKGTR